MQYFITLLLGVVAEAQQPVPRSGSYPARKRQNRPLIKASNTHPLIAASNESAAPHFWRLLNLEKRLTKTPQVWNFEGAF
jgi:hypothetical protein